MMTTQRIPAGVGPYTGAAINAMKGGDPGDKINREQMARIIGRDVTSGSLGYGNVNSAINHVLSHHGKVWKWSTAEQAWCCLDDAGAVELSAQTTHTARRRARKSVRISSVIDTSKLTSEQVQQHSVNLAVGGLMAMAGSASFAKKLIAHDATKMIEPNPAKVIELMKRV